MTGTELFRMRIIEIGAATFASPRLFCTIYPEADRRVAMGMIRGAVDKTSSMKDVDACGLRQDPGFAGDRTRSAAGHECRDPEIDEQSDQALDSSRSRGYGRYEI
jgi:hypothetical protein